MIRLRVDKTKCSGIGLCEVTAPTVYEVGEDGQAFLLNESPAESDLPAVQEAIANCPTAALSIED